MEFEHAQSVSDFRASSVFGCRPGQLHSSSSAQTTFKGAPHATAPLAMGGGQFGAPRSAPPAIPTVLAELAPPRSRVTLAGHLSAPSLTHRRVDVILFAATGTLTWQVFLTRIGETEQIGNPQVSCRKSPPRAPLRPYISGRVPQVRMLA